MSSPAGVKSSKTNKQQSLNLDEKFGVKSTGNKMKDVNRFIDRITKNLNTPIEDIPHANLRKRFDNQRLQSFMIEMKNHGLDANSERTQRRQYLR